MCVIHFTSTHLPLPRFATGGNRKNTGCNELVFFKMMTFSSNWTKYQGVKEFHMLARVGCCNIMVFSPFKVKVTYYHPLNLWLLGATSGNQGQIVMCLQCSETIKICLKLQIPYYHPLNLWLLGATNGNQGQTVMHL